MTDINNSLPQAKATGSAPQSDASRAVLVGVVGGVISAASFLVFQRLPDEKRDEIQRAVRRVIESKANEIRQNLNI